MVRHNIDYTCMRAIAEACGLSSACGRSHIEDHIHATLAKQSVHLGRFETAVSTLSSLDASSRCI